jgi:ketosteroid isomerase-like protein
MRGTRRGLIRLVPADNNQENPMTTTREVFDRHMSHQLDRDLDAILTDYAPDAIVVGPDGIGSGHDHIRASYEQVLPLIGSLDVTSVQMQGEVVYVSFRAHSDGSDDLVGTDTFVIRDGLIHIHTFYAATQSRAQAVRP